jgi:hypothetical protein
VVISRPKPGLFWGHEQVGPDPSQIGESIVKPLIGILRGVKVRCVSQSAR